MDYMRQAAGKINGKGQALSTDYTEIRDGAIQQALLHTWKAHRRDVPYNNKIKEHRCTTPRCGKPSNWDPHLWTICSEECRLVYEHEAFYSRALTLR